MTRDAVMFDLDGTLADTLADIAAAGNTMLESFQRPPRPVADYRYLAGQGVEYLVEHALGGSVDAATIAEGVAVIKAFYAEHEHERTRAFPGIAELLDALTDRGVTLAVLTNKPQDPAEELVKRLLGGWSFATVRGALPDGPLKPDPAGALAIVDALAIPAARWVYVGDTRVDMETGKRAGFFTVGVTWGFRDEAELLAHGADAIVHEPTRILGLL